MNVIAISNQKGGVGKSTTVSALGAGLRRCGYRVLFIDMDAQGNLTYSMGGKIAAASTLEILTGTASARAAIQQTEQGDLIAASPALAGADLLLTDTGKEYRLKEALEDLEGEYDYILLDTPPALGTLTVNALTAADGVIVPAQADAYSLQGLGQLLQTVRTVKKYCNDNLRILGILITRYSARTVLSRQMTEMLQDTADQLHTRLYAAKIRECTAIKEAQAMQKSIYDYCPKSNATTDYSAFLEEFLTG